MVLLQAMVLGLGVSGTFLVAKYSAQSEDRFHLAPQDFLREAGLAAAAVLCRWVRRQPLLCVLVGLFLVGTERDPVAKAILYTLATALLAGLCLPVICTLINDSIERSEKQWAAMAAKDFAAEQRSSASSSLEVTGDLKVADVSSETTTGSGAVQKVMSSSPSGMPVLPSLGVTSPKLDTRCLA